MAETLNLTKVDFTDLNDDVNLIIEENSELKRLSFEDAFGSSIIASDVNNDGNIVLGAMQEGSSPSFELDTELGTEGMAADSKAVADAIEALRQEILGGAW
jgi:hypothetical protein